MTITMDQVLQIMPSICMVILVVFQGREIDALRKAIMNIYQTHGLTLAIVRKSIPKKRFEVARNEVFKEIKEKTDQELNQEREGTL